MVHELAAHLALVLQSVPPQQNPTDKALELAASFSQSLSQWAYIVLGGSVAVLLKDLKYRPQDKWLRRSFWLFVPGWILLGFSIYEGIRVQQRYVARWMSLNPQIDRTVAEFNHHTTWQIWLMKWGLLTFVLWLAFFLIRWITHEDDPPKDALDEC